MDTASSHDAADRALRAGAALVHRSDRGKLALSGPDAKVFLTGQVTNDVLGLTPGTGCYAALLTPKGKMRADLRILDAGHEILIDTERVALQALFDTIRTFKLGYDVALHKRTLECALLSVCGPTADEITGTPASAAMSGEHSHTLGHIGGRDVRLIRTDSGIDVLTAASDGEWVADALVATGAVAIPESAAEVLRIEHGRPRYGIDLDETVIPQEAGLNERAVSFTKGCYVGQETVARLFYRGKPNRHLRGIKGERPLTVGETLTADERPVGTVTSAALSSRLGPVGLAMVRREVAPGGTVTLTDGSPALVVELPFASPPTAP